MAVIAANPKPFCQTTDPRNWRGRGGGRGGRGARRSKVPLGPHLFMMALENSNQMKTHKKAQGSGRGVGGTETGVGFTAVGVWGAVALEPKSSLHWSGGGGQWVGGGFEPSGASGGGMGPPVGPLPQPRLPAEPLAFLERIWPGKPGQRLFYGEETAFLKGGVTEITS